MTKQELRKTYLGKRHQLTIDEYKELNERIASQFFQSGLTKNIQILHSFLPIEKNKEPNTWLIIDRIRKEFSQLKISVPRINNQSSVLDNFFYEGKEQLENNLWGIPEPKNGVPTANENIDAVLVPLLAVDLQGHRVGYGRGFYDKFLSKLKPSTKKIGLSFFPPVEKIADVHDNDYLLTHLITPEKVYHFE